MTPITRSTLTGQVEEALKREIASGVLPPGHPLRANEIAERYGISATPTREAMQRLTAQGLIVLDSKHTSRVADVSVEDLEDVYWLRQMLEPLALRRSIERATPAWLPTVVRAMEEMRVAARDLSTAAADVLAWSQAHQHFHFALFATAGSPQLERILTNLYHHSERYRMLVKGVAEAGNTDEHEAIVSHLQEGEHDAAVEALASHYGRTVALLRATGLPASAIRASDADHRPDRT